MSKRSALDRKILSALMHNSRAPIATLARKVGASREVVAYRMKRLKERGIILDFVTQVNIHKLGYKSGAVFIAIRTQKELEFKRYLQNNPNISWVAELSGVWSYGMSIIGRSDEEIDRKFFEMENAFKDIIIDHRFTMQKQSHFFYEKYFAEQRASSAGKYLMHIADAVDKQILKTLASNARIEYAELAKAIGLSAPAIRNRIARLEGAGYIEKYSLFVDVAKLGAYQYSVFVVNKNAADRTKLLAYLSDHPNVSFIAEYVGNPFLELGLFVEDPYAVRSILRVIEQSFPDNRIIEISLFSKEMVSVGPPPCVFA